MSSQFQASIVIASYNSKNVLHRTLPFAIRQAEQYQGEVIVVDSSTDGSEKIIATEYPSVQLVHFDKRLYPQQAKQIGVDLSKAPVIAMLDIDCQPSEEWLTRKLQAHGAGEHAVFGSIYCHPDCPPIGWAYYFVEFSYFLQYRSRSYISKASECSISYSRVVFDQLRYADSARLATDALFHRAVHKNGFRIFFDPDHTAFHYYDTTLRNFFRHEFIHARDSIRNDRSVPSFNIIPYILAGPLLPLLKLGYIIRCLWGSSYTVWPQFFRVLPLTILGTIAWTSGAWWGRVNKCVHYMKRTKAAAYC
jgi:GT2 family glycosyltransferase